MRTSGDYATALGYAAFATGSWSTAAGSSTMASGDSSTALGYGTAASGNYSTAVGSQTTASGNYSTATGYNSIASGDVSTAMGYHTAAAGYASTAMGSHTAAAGQSSAAMGHAIETFTDEALVNSGTITGKTLAFHADQRLVSDTRPADLSALLRNVLSFRVVTHAPSDNVCRHHQRTVADCAAPASRTTGLLAQQVALAVPSAVTSVSSLKLTDVQRNGQNHRHGGATAAATAANGTERETETDVVEHVVEVQSLDVHALLAQLVGAVQSLSGQNQQQAVQNKAQTAQLNELIRLQAAQNAVQAGQIKELQQQLLRSSEGGNAHGDRTVDPTHPQQRLS